MASSSSQASKGSEKRKRDKAELDESSNKKKRKHGKATKDDAAGTLSMNGDADRAEDEETTNQYGAESRFNGDILETKTLQKWRISEPMGGRMSDVDPIFNADEK